MVRTAQVIKQGKNISGRREPCALTITAAAFFVEEKTMTYADYKEAYETNLTKYLRGRHEMVHYLVSLELQYPAFCAEYEASI